MKTSALLLSLVPAICALDVATITCKSSGNNCQRGVGGSNGKPALSVRQADCASFLSVTVTPAASTATVTVDGSTTQTTTTVTSDPFFGPEFTSTTTIGVVGAPQTFTKRTATAIPTYATYCADPSAYASACFCAGVTPSTTTASIPTVTEYVAAATQTVLITECVVVNQLRKRGLGQMANVIDYVFH